ncbi:MAG: hypothetical protein ACI4GD_10285 [Lachnospiraceae bacterium]
MNKKKILTTLCIAAVAIISGYGGVKAYQSHAVILNEVISDDVEALSYCEVTATAKKGFVTIASAYLECKGKGICQIPDNEFKLTASCSGKQVKYELSVMGNKVN